MFEGVNMTLVPLRHLALLASVRGLIGRRPPVAKVLRCLVEALNSGHNASLENPENSGAHFCCPVEVPYLP